MTRIAWIVYGALAERTGGTIYDRKIIEGLGDVDVVSLERGTDAGALVRRLARMRPDVIVGDELCFRELAFVFPRAPFARRILLVHHLTCWEEERPPSERRRARAGEAQALRAADFAIATSRATAERLAREGHRGRVEVVPPGCDRLARMPPVGAAGRGEPAVRFVFVGAVIARKRVRELVAALPAGASLRVVGSLERERRYAESVRAAAAERAVTFLGEVDDAALARELAAADALVMPSSLEGYGIAATEAIAAGVPVIAAAMPGLDEALAAGAFARIDSGGLAPALDRFSTDAALRARMRAAASAARLPTWAEAVARFAKLVH